MDAAATTSIAALANKATVKIEAKSSITVYL